MKYTADDTIELDPSLIAGYILLRSPTDKFKFNCYAVDKEDELLFCAASDLDFEKASAWVEAINKEYFPVVPTETELVEIQLENEQRIFSAAK
jgi:hypothetical protein